MTKSKHIATIVEYKDQSHLSPWRLKFPEIAKTMTKMQYRCFIAKETYKRNHDRIREQQHRIYLRDKGNPEFMARLQYSNRMTRRKIKVAAISHYSNGTMRCACCGERELLFLTIDHITNDGAEHRRLLKSQGQLGGNRGLSGYKFSAWLRGNNYPPGFQVLCMNCNMGKGLNDGICPHQTNLLGALV